MNKLGRTLTIMELLLLLLLVYWLRRKREPSFTINGFGQAHTVTDAERERNRKHPDFRPPWEDT